MEWEEAAIVLDVRPYAEADAIATVLTQTHGAHRGLARGGNSRGRASLWQPGNIVRARWVGRLAEQLGALSAELVHPAAALAMEDPLALAMLRAACAVAEGALPDRVPHERLFAGLLHLLAHLPQGPTLLADLIRWEAALLADLGYGLDLSPPPDGRNAPLAFVSPRSGRAVSERDAGDWKPRLLRLPTLLLHDEAGAPEDWRDGLRLTGHFLARDAFGLQHRPLPAARQALYDRVAALAETDPNA
jgi:DNA repair protein RecO (recombination protein O)